MPAIEIFLVALAFLGLCLYPFSYIKRLKVQTDTYEQAREKREKLNKESEELNRENVQLLKEYHKFITDAKEGRICKFCERELKTETKG